MRNSITTRLIGLLMIFSTLIIGTGMGIDYVISRQEILTRLQAESQETINRAIIDLENLLQSIEGTTLLLASILEQREYSREGLAEIVRGMVERSPDVYGATFAIEPTAESPEGFAPYFFKSAGEIKSADLRQGSNPYWERSWYRDAVAASAPVWVEPYFDTEGAGVLMTTFSVPVFRYNEGRNQVLGVVTADLPLSELQDYLKHMRLGANGFGLLFSKEGIILGSRDQDDVMQHFSNALNPPQVLERWAAMLEAALAGELVHEELECDEFFGECRVRLSRLETTGWPVGVAYSVEEVLAPLHTYQIKTALIGATTILVVCLTVSIVSRRLTGPIRDLASAANEVAQGNLKSKLPIARGSDELAHLVGAFSEMQSNLTKNIHKLEVVTANRSRLEGELTAARDIQMSMLPGGGEANFEEQGVTVWAKVEPARSVGGDLYTYLQIRDQLFIAVGDVSDKGVPAALFMARAISLIQQLAETEAPPSESMAALNNALERNNPSCMFVTLFLGVMDTHTGTLRFASAGHTPPLLIREKKACEINQRTGPALGLMQDQSYPENTVSLQEGDRIAVFTDGVDEAFDESDHMYGLEKFKEQLQITADERLTTAGRQAFGAIHEHAGSQPQSDDITLLLLQFGGPKTDISVQSFSLEENITSRVQAWLEPLLTEWRLDHTTEMEMQLVAEELATNVQKYARLDEKAEIALQLERAGTLLVLEIRDKGIAFNPLTEGNRAPIGADIGSAEIGGLGVHLVTQLTDRQSYHRDGAYNVLRVEKDLPAATD